MGKNPKGNVKEVLFEAKADALNNIGYIHQQQGIIPLALEYYQKSHDIEKELGNKKGMAT